VSGPFSMEALIGYAFVLGLLAVAIRASRKPETRPAAFGIVWFFLALMPTSLLPLAEVTNDHRMFFPFVGLSLAVFWSLRLVLFRKTSRLARARSWQLCAIAGVVLVLGAAAAGTHERNKVWRTDESLWRDVVAKSPRNGRGLMNYGLIFMQRGDYASALSYFNRALAYTPNYWAVETNLGIANGAIGRAGDAEMHFVRALTLGPEVADAHFFYARWLDSVGRADEAAGRLEKAVQLNPRSLEWRHVLIALYTKLGNSDGRARIAKEALQLAPGDEIAKQALTQSAGRTVQPAVAAVAASADGAEELLKASNEFYRAGQYEESIAAAKQALELRPEYAEAYNNIAAANNALHRWNEGIWAAMQAVRIKPDYQLARYNLAWGMTQKTRAKVK